MIRQQAFGAPVQRRGVAQDTLALVLAGGNGSRLGGLTQQHCKPALPFAGIFRNIDFTLSNCINSDIRRIAVLTQYKQQSLLQHLASSWGFLRRAQNEFIDVWSAQQRGEDNKYLGTADAVGQNLDRVLEQAPKYTLILAGDHIYQMDYRRLLAFHQQHNAQLTVASVEVPSSQVQQFGIIKTIAAGQICEFLEKPAHAASLANRQGCAQASMGIYVFDTEFLLRALQTDAAAADSSHDFGHDVLPWAIERRQHKVYACPFHDSATGSPGYWRDVGSVDAYWQAHMDLLDEQPALNIFDPSWPLLPWPVHSLPASFRPSETGVPGLAIDSLLAGGCIINGATVDNCVLSTDVTIGPDSLVQHSVLLPGVNIGAGCQLNRAIVASDCKVPNGTQAGLNPALDGLHFDLSADGIVVITAEGLQRYQATHQDVA